MIFFSPSLLPFPSSAWVSIPTVFFWGIRGASLSLPVLCETRAAQIWESIGFSLEERRIGWATCGMCATHIAHYIVLSGGYFSTAGGSLWEKSCAYNERVTPPH